MVTDRFNTSSDYEVISQFHSLKQVGTIMNYVDKFEEMVSMVKRHNPSLSDNYFISSFISRLKEQIQYHVQCHKPVSLSAAYWYAKRLEQATPPLQEVYCLYSTEQDTQTRAQRNKRKRNPIPAHTPAELKVAGKCFRCREPWVPGHTKVCKVKQIYSIILIETEEGKEEVVVVEDVDSETTLPKAQTNEVQIH
jgi:hypothetical protein